MLVYNKYSSKATLVPNLVQNKESDWANFYDKYASIIYGAILEMTGDEVSSTEILEEIFLDLYKKKVFSPYHTTFCMSLLRHTFQLTVKYLETKGLKVHQSFNENYPLINLFYFKQVSLKEVAMKTNTIEKEVLKNLREEFNHFL
jgi:DNA-directed RNA polymerase specialized sigma24 family protein